MLDIETRRRIDEARDILVGKIPDPKSQVEQITIALIYKFMNDIDAESEELGGERTFFAGEFDKYRWANLVHSGLSGDKMLNLYTEALVRIPENPNIPPLFREIFNNVYLPYRDPETLRMFFNVIDDFTYDNSERLGDAFEHLLSVLGSQGDAGQFRTPRHIIDFMVKIIDPQKDERVMDPACGTAGFLISSYKHIRDASSDDLGRTTLTPDEHARLVTNLVGYDISPDMVRLSLVNMYLHGFPQPNIHEYDTLTSEERWDEYSNVILANPPFMSPKGGIRPHNRFSVQSTRSEVLFVDYIAEHLTPDGRAAVIVPDGVIFQSQNAHRQLRKMLLEEHLAAVVSLPAGVFKPYSGVKTSILIMERALARRADSIAFFKIASDGYELGDQRRVIEENDLPAALDDIAEFIRRMRAGESLDEFRPTTGLIVDKKRIAEDGEYNLSGDRYLSDNLSISEWPMVKLEDLCYRNLGGGTPSTENEEYWKGNIPWITSADIIDLKTAKPRKYITEDAIKESATNLIPRGNLIVVTRVGLGKLFRNDFDVCISQDSRGLILKDVINADYLVYVLKDRVENFSRVSRGSTIQGVTKKQLAEIQIPLPPLELQREIAAEIEGYQRVMDGARMVIENYRPHIAVDPEWPMVEIGECCEVKSGGTPKRSVEAFWGGDIPWVGSGTCKNDLVNQPDEFITQEGLTNSSAKLFPKHTTLVALVGATIGKTGYLAFDCTTNQNVAGLFPKNPDILNPTYLFYAAQMLYPEFLQLGQRDFRMANLSFVRKLAIPLPPPITQSCIVSEIEVEQSLVTANLELVNRMKAKIDAAIGRVLETISKT